MFLYYHFIGMKNLLKKSITKKVIKKASDEKTQKTKKITKKDLINLNLENEKKIKLEMIKIYKQNLEKKQNLENNKKLENSKKSKLDWFSLYWQKENINNLNDWYLLNTKKDFLLNLNCIKDEKTKILLLEYNKIISIWKWLNLNEIDKIILEWLKFRLMSQYIDNFYNNLNQKNIKNIKKLNQFFTNSNLKKLIKNKKIDDLNIIIENQSNIFWNSNFLVEFYNRLENKFILDYISKNEKIKTNSIKKKKNQNLIEYQNFKKSKNEFLNFTNNLREKNKFKSIYNLISKNLDLELNKNSDLLKVNIILNRLKNKLDKKWLYSIKKFNLIKKQILEYYNIDKILIDYNIKKDWLYNKYKKVNTKLDNRLKYKSDNYFKLKYWFLEKYKSDDNLYLKTTNNLLNILDFTLDKNYKNFKYNKIKFTKLDYNLELDDNTYNKNWIDKILIK